jgi:hypothetical protein
MKSSRETPQHIKLSTSSSTWQSTHHWQHCTTHDTTTTHYRHLHNQQQYQHRTYSTQIKFNSAEPCAFLILSKRQIPAVHEAIRVPIQDTGRAPSRELSQRAQPSMNYHAVAGSLPPKSRGLYEQSKLLSPNISAGNISETVWFPSDPGSEECATSLDPSRQCIRQGPACHTKMVWTPRMHPFRCLQLTTSPLKGPTLESKLSGVVVKCPPPNAADIPAMAN